MAYDLFLAWRELRARPLHTAITTLVIALAVALPIVVLALGDGARRGIVQASDPFGVLVVGAKGSAQQLVLNTLLLQGVPVGNINAALYDTLIDDARAALVVPLAMGDNVGGARILGTSDALLQLRREQDSPPAFQVAQGRFFANDFEAVLGSRAAGALGLGIGDRFLAEHGVERGLASDAHEQPFTVVGIFAPTQTAYDSAVFVNVNSVWRAHERDADDPLTAFAAGGAALDNQLTALLVKPVGFVEANLLWQEFAGGQVAQAAFPGQELGALFDLFRLAETVLTAVGYLVLGIGALVVFLSMYSAIAAREQSIAVMRSVGGGRTSIFRMVMFEALATVIIGALLGRFLGYLITLGFASVISEQTTIHIPIRYLTTIEPLLWAITLLVGIVAGLLPAIRAYSVSVVDKLFSS
jgi:putative ABC transport system permease protein